MTTQTPSAPRAPVSAASATPPLGIWGIPLQPVPPQVEAYRERFRAANPLIWLRGWRHFAGITLLGAGMTSLSARMLRATKWWEWAAIPAAFLIANAVEWLAHRYPMHHPMGKLRVMYEKHTLEHHLFFTEEAMEAPATRDFNAVLFSLTSLAVFLIGMGVPLALGFFVFVSRNTGWIFAAIAVDYYVLYEYCHLAYHLPEDSWVGRLPGMARLRRHHTHHHDQTLMADWNFNVTFPICDRLFGTHFERARRAGRV